MNRFILTLTLTCAMTSAFAASQKKSKSELKADYVVAGLKLDKTKQAKLKPLVLQYFKDVKSAKTAEGTLKKKYKDAIKKNQLTDAQADELLKARWTEDAKLASVHEGYTVKFKQVISAKQVYRLFKLAKESSKKIVSSDKDSED